MRAAFAFLALLLASLNRAAVADPVREIEISPDPAEGGQQIFNIRIKPGETRSYDRITFDCTYHQEYVSQATDTLGKKIVNEPASFTYRAREVKLVDDLDRNIAFRVPVGLPKLMDMFGLTAFNTNAPVTISQIRITAFTAEGKAWSYDLKAEGLHKLESAPAPTPPAKP